MLIKGIITFVVAIILGLVIYQSTNLNTLVYLTAKSCNPLDNICPLDGSFGIKIKASPQSPTQEGPIQIELFDPKNHIGTATLEMIGINMTMPSHQTEFKRKGHGLQANTMLGLCTEKVMKWRAKIVMNNHKVRYWTYFDFEVPNE